LWTDTDNVFTTYDGNTVTNNWGAGIFHETSYSATIVNNHVSGNGFGDSNGWLWDAGIQISSSGGQGAATPIAIYGNTVTNNYNGISLLQQNRGSGAMGAYLVQNVNVHDNTVTMSRGGTGVVEDNGDAAIWTRNNTFAHDSYHVNGSGGRWFAWAGDSVVWSAWRALGLDVSGSLR
jgi:parallel beta-helix repeat protein